MDEETRPSYLDVAHLHVHGGREVQRAAPGALRRLGPEDRLRATEGRRSVRVPDQHGTEDQHGCDTYGRR